MDRRQFIRVLGFGVGAVALSSTVTACGNLDAQVEDYGWSGPSADVTDIRLKVLSYAVLAPNPDNKQPWIVRMTGPESFELYVDPERLLPETDPFFRQIHIGQGTFLETLSIAATGLGHKAEIELFPQGMYGNTELLNKPVAAIRLIPQEGIRPDPLFPYLLTRHSNKREYDTQPLSQAQLNTLSTFSQQNNQYPLTMVDSPTDKQKMEAVLTQSMEIEVGDRARDLETIAMFRFNDEEIRQYRDGFGTAQSGLSGIKRILVENLFLSRESAEKDPTEFGQQSVTMTQKAAQSTGTFAWISSASNNRMDQVNVGRDYCRINLKTTAMGLAQHPMSQVLQEYEEMLPLQASFKQYFGIKDSDTVQMLFRLGTAQATPHSPRRAISDLIHS